MKSRDLLIAKVLAALIVGFLCYLIGGFVSLNFNIVEWTANSRAVVVLFAVATYFLVSDKPNEE